MLLAAAGLVSAVFTVAVPLVDVSQFGVGFVFGVALAVYFVFYEGYSNPAKIAAFIFACTAAFPASEFTAFRLVEIVHVNASMGSAKLDIPLPVFWGAGFVGAFLVLASGMFLFGPRNITWESLGKVLLWSIGGGLLGVVAGGADGIRTHGTYHEMFLLFLIWQPAAAALLGLSLSRERRVLATPSTSVPTDGTLKVPVNRGILVVAGIFFACLLGFFDVLVFRTVQSQRMVARMDAANKRSFDEAPSIVNLPRIEPLTSEQALIVGEIAGLYPWAPRANSSGQLSPVWPPAVNYVVGYTATKEPSPASVRRIVAVDVTQLPNAEWARYRVKYPQPSIAINSPQSLTNVTKFGQTIVQNTYRRDLNGGGTLCFLWPSGNFVVSVCYETPQVDEGFLRQYLEKYPSSL